MATYTAETGYVGLAIQTAQGAFREPTDYMKVLSIEMNPDGEKLVPEVEIGSGSDVTEVHQGSYRINGDLESYIRPEAIGVLFYALLGKYTASGELNGGQGNYLHNFTPIVSGSLPWVSVKKVISDNIQTYNYRDNKVNSFNLELKAGEFANASFNLVGIADEIGTPGVASFETAPLLVATKATINMGPAALSAKNLSFEYNNNLVDDDYRIGSRFLGDISERRRDLEVTLDVVLDTTSELYRKSFYGGAALTSAGFDVYADSLDIVMDSPTVIGTSVTTYKILIQIKRCVFMSAPVPASGDDLVVIPLTLKPVKYLTNNILEIHIWNGKSAYSF